MGPERFCLTGPIKYDNSASVMKTYSTAQVARMIGVHKQTLLRWLYAGSIPEPKRYSSSGVDFRIWTDRDVERIRRYKGANYRKGRGRKKTQKKSGNR